MMPGSVSPPPKKPGEKWPAFLLNRSGLPLDDLTWNELWEFACHLYPDHAEELKKIRTEPITEKVPFPRAPSIALANKKGKVKRYLTKVSEYLHQLNYNHTGTQFFETRPNASLMSLMDLAKSMVREALPIRCVEASILSIHLTNGIPGLGRFTINFKSELVPNLRSEETPPFYYHVMLGILYANRFGTLGLSQYPKLGDKPLVYTSLQTLLDDYEASYKEYGHTVVKLRIGKLIPHDPHSIQPIPWKGITVHPKTDDKVKMRKKIDTYSRELKASIKTGKSWTL